MQAYLSSLSFFVTIIYKITKLEKDTHTQKEKIERERENKLKLCQFILSIIKYKRMKSSLGGAVNFNPITYFTS